MSVAVYALASVLIVSVISLVGVITLAVSKKTLDKIIQVLVSFAAGALFGDAFIHLIPESFKTGAGEAVITSLYIIASIMIFFVLEKFLRWRHCHLPESKEHAHPVGALSLVGDALHNFFDGLVIGASYFVSIPLGIATTIAIILHEIPQEIGDFAILVKAGFSRKKALFYNFLSALTAVAGAVFSVFVGSGIGGYLNIMVPVTAGGFIYIAGSDLIPELHTKVEVKESLLQFFSIIAGIFVMVLLALVG